MDGEPAPDHTVEYIIGGIVIFGLAVLGFLIYPILAAPPPPPKMRLCDKEGREIPENQWTESRCSLTPRKPSVVTVRVYRKKSGGMLTEYVRGAEVKISNPMTGWVASGTTGAGGLTLPLTIPGEQTDTILLFKAIDMVMYASGETSSQVSSNTYTTVEVRLPDLP